MVYVRNPVDTRYEIINIYVPEAYYNGGEIGGFNAETYAIFLPTKSAAMATAEPGKPALERANAASQKTAKIAQRRPGCPLQRLRRRIPGARSRTEPTGKAPAAIVDLKAAVRYRKANNKVMPGDAENHFQRHKRRRSDVRPLRRNSRPKRLRKPPQSLRRGRRQRQSFRRNPHTARLPIWTMPIWLTRMAVQRYQ